MARETEWTLSFAHLEISSSQLVAKSAARKARVAHSDVSKRCNFSVIYRKQEHVCSLMRIQHSVIVNIECTGYKIIIFRFERTGGGGGGGCGWGRKRCFASGPAPLQGRFRWDTCPELHESSLHLYAVYLFFR